MLGIASHIYSAAKKGPRGRGGLTEDEIKHPDNGVWCCAYHGRLIDTNDGGAYPASLLRGWKRVQEARIRWEMDHQWTPVGWIHEARINRSFLFRPDAILPLSKCTILQGASVGKTALADWIAASAGLKTLERWRGSERLTISTLTYFAPEKKTVELATNKSELQLRINDVGVAEPPRDFSVVMLREDFWNFLRRYEDHDVTIANLLSVEREAVRHLEDDIHRNGTPWGRDLNFVEEVEELDDDEIDPGTENRHLIVLRKGAPDGVTFGGLSSSEKIRVLIEFAAALARSRAKHGPVLLILDGSGWTITDEGLAFYAEFLQEQPYQTLLTRHGGWMPKNKAPWECWQRICLTGPSGAAEILPEQW